MSKRLLSLFFAVALLSLVLPVHNLAAAADEKLLYSFPFDNEAEQGENISAGEVATIEWVSSSGIGHGDDTALKVTHNEGMTYRSSDNAIRVTLPEALPTGGVYRVVAWVYAPSADNPDKKTLTGPGFVLNADYGGDQGIVKFPPDFGTLPVDEWKQIDVTLPMHDEPIETLDFRIVINDEPNHPDVWYWDNIEIYQVGDLEAAAAVGGESDDGTITITRSKTGQFEDFDYELWSQRGTDEVSMTLTGGGTFKCSWDALNILFRTGKKLGSTKTYEEYGDVIMEYGADVTITRGSVNYLCVYGWTEDPMIEFYILEDYGSYKPGEKLVGTYEVDGSSYELYTATRVEQPSIQGTKTFEQYFGIRVDKRTEGTINISEHFKAWDNLGLDMSGKMYEVALCMEGYQSGGSANIYKHMLTVGDTTYGSDLDAPRGEDEPAVPEETPAEIEEPSPSPAAETPSETVEPSPSAAEPPANEDSPSNLPLILGIGAAVLAGCVIFIVMKKKK